MFDTNPVRTGLSLTAGAAFDGRYVYFAPQGSYAVRYDTQASFSSASAWTTFDVTTVDAGAHGFSGAVFDGRYLYFVPYNNGSVSGLSARFDTQATFTSAASWTTFNTASVNANAVGFRGGTFDGRYVYFIPSETSTSTMARFDTTMSFTAAGAWTSFDLSGLGTSAVGNHFGGVFDGRYVYVIPNVVGGLTPSGVIVRHDTTGNFTSSASWSQFDVSTVVSGASGFATSAFDGRYLYLVPFGNVNWSGRDGLIVRYDTTSALSSSASWSSFDATTLQTNAKGFGAGATFDGRFVYFFSHETAYQGSPTFGSATGIVVRYDTQASFSSSSSWSSFDATSLDAQAKGLGSSVFDGTYVYVASDFGRVARFSAKTPPSMPILPGWTGSFY